MIEISKRLLTLRIALIISPNIGIGAGPGIPIRRKILFVRKLYLTYRNDL
jgi:hypothetical protein